MPNRTSAEALVKSAEKEWLDRWKRGPTRIRWKKLPLQEGDSAPDFKLEDSSGRARRLSEFWSRKPALLLFWRHFGCGCGVGRAERLRNEYHDYVKAGANVVVIGQGEPQRAKAYAQRYGIPCPILSDPAFKAYKTYGLREGGPVEILYDASEDLFRCEFQAGVDLQKARREAGINTVDSPWQLPGEFVIAPNGLIRFAYRYQYCDNYPDPQVLVAAIKPPRADL